MLTNHFWFIKNKFETFHYWSLVLVFTHKICLLLLLEKFVN